MVVAMLVGVAALVGSRFFGPPDAMRTVVLQARELDRVARSRLEDLGLRYAPRPENDEPALDIEAPTDADFEFLFGVLATNDQKARVSAARVLKDIGDPRAVLPLVRGIRGIEPVDVFLLECAFTILDRPDVAPERRIAALAPVWENERERLSDEMREAVRLKLRDAGALDPAFLRDAAVRHGDPTVRKFAIRELGALPRPPGGVLAAAMTDPDEAVRQLAHETFLLAGRKRGALGRTP